MFFPQIESKDCTTHCDETILSPTCWINTIKWEIDKELKNTLPYHTPNECPRDKKYVPPGLCHKLITWAHTTPATGHSGSRKDTGRWLMI